MSIHPTAIIDPQAKVHPSCKIGPYCTIGANVELGEGCDLVSHVAIQGPTKIGKDNGIFPFASIGMAPQDLTYKGEPTRLEIGDGNEIREFVTINRGTVKGGGLTKVGSNVLVMAYTHIAHDCVIGDNVILANAATLGGHVIVEDWAQVGALCPVHHFIRIGTHAFVGGGTTVTLSANRPLSRRPYSHISSLGGAWPPLFPRKPKSGLNGPPAHAYEVLLASKLNTTQAIDKLKSEPDRGEDVDMLIRLIETSAGSD